MQSLVSLTKYLSTFASYEPRHTYQVAQCAIYSPLLPHSSRLPYDLRLLGGGSSHVSVS